MRHLAAAAFLGFAILGCAILRFNTTSAVAGELVAMAPSADAADARLPRKLMRLPGDGQDGAAEEAPPRGLSVERMLAQWRRRARSNATAEGVGAIARGAPQRQLLYGPPAGCYTIRDGRLMVIFHVEGLWDIPGGEAEPDETPEQTAAREVWEETGWNVSIDGLIQVTQNGFFIFRCHTITGEPHGIADPHEVVSWNWFLKSDIEASTPWRFREEQELFISLF